jgi:hypothetical protein
MTALATDVLIYAATNLIHAGSRWRSI